ncbi:MAG TPA: hypothetical protein DDZ80_26955 [Cyanobacteria bacterium UBA8803]|nr:hypothetical protein [Cyanobacteria bacterium UBA9273]HBL61916.1 hypothetical protein [Cyanobacteria bacterium UBA8803]
MVTIRKVEEADWIDVVGTDDYNGSSFGQDGIDGIIGRTELISDDKIRLSSPRTSDVNPYFTEEIGNNAAGDWSDVDLFGVTLEKDDRLIIDVDSFDDDGNGQVNRPIDTMLRIFNQGGTEISRAGNGIDPDSGLFSDDPVLEFIAPNDGTFYIGISAQGNGQYNPNLRPGNDPNRRDPRNNQTQPPEVERNYQVELTLFPPPQPQTYFFINDVILLEGTETQNAAVPTAFLSAPSNSLQYVIVESQNGTALAWEDFFPTFPNQSVPFNPGATTGLILIPLVNDNIVELDEELTVHLFDPDPNSGPFVADPIGEITIRNDDQAIINISDAPSLIEGDRGQKEAVFTVTMSNPVDVPVTLNYAIDYMGISGSITFNRLSTTPQTISVPVNGDTVVEFNKTFFANLTGLNAQGRNVTIADSQGVGTIIDDDLATISINNVEIVEGDSGQTFANFTVSLSNPVATDVTLNVVTTPGTGTENVDYAAVTGPISFAALTTTPQTVSIPVNGDNLVEDNETLLVNLNSLNAGGLETRITVNSPGLGTILNDDYAPEVAFECPCNVIKEGDSLILEVIATDQDDPVLSYNWDLNGDGNYDLKTNTSTLEINWADLQSLGIGLTPINDPIYLYQGSINLEVSDGTNTATTSADLRVKQQQLPELIDLTGFDQTDTVTLNITLTREANFNNILRFYRTDAQGRVDGLLPGDAGYEDAVLANLLTEPSLTVNNRKTANLTVDFLGGAYYAPALVIVPKGGIQVDDTLATIGDAFTDPLGARVVRNGNTWSFEDWTDFDLNDMVLSINFPEPPPCLC